MSQPTMPLLPLGPPPPPQAPPALSVQPILLPPPPPPPVSNNNNNNNNNNNIIHDNTNNTDYTTNIINDNTNNTDYTTNNNNNNINDNTNNTDYTTNNNNNSNIIDNDNTDNTNNNTNITDYTTTTTNNNNNNFEVATPLHHPHPLPFHENFGTSFDNVAASRSPSPGALLRKKGKNFLSKEDDQLARSWIEACHDPEVGTKITSPEFWDKVRASFVVAIPDSDARTARSLQMRWRTCERAVERFCDCVTTVRARPEGFGKSWVDEINDASKLYRELYAAEFGMLSCWTILRQELKWQEILLQKKKPRKRTRPTVNGDENDNNGQGGGGGVGNFSPYPMTPDLGRETKRIALERDYVEAPLRTMSVETPLRTIPVETPLRPISVETPLRTISEILPKNDAVESSLRAIAESLAKNESVEASLRSIAESLAKIAQETEKKNRIMETATAKAFDEQIMARPILGLYPHQRQYYELQQNRILNSLVKKLEKENDGGVTPNLPEATTSATTSATRSEAPLETPAPLPETNEMQFTT